MGGLIDERRLDQDYKLVAIRQERARVTLIVLGSIGISGCIALLGYFAMMVLFVYVWGKAHEPHLRVNANGLASGRDLDDSHLVQLEGNVTVTEVRVYSDGITDAGVASIAKAPNVRSLSLSGSRITNTCLTAIESMKNLESVELYNTSITADGLERLSNARPDLLINPDVLEALEWRRTFDDRSTAIESLRTRDGPA